MRLWTQKNKICFKLLKGQSVRDKGQIQNHPFTLNVSPQFQPLLFALQSWPFKLNARATL